MDLEEYTEDEASSTFPVQPRAAEMEHAPEMEHEDQDAEKPRRNIAMKLAIGFTVCIAVVIAIIVIGVAGSFLVNKLYATPSDVSTSTITAVFKPNSREELRSAVDACVKLSPVGDCSRAPNGPIGEWDVSDVADMSNLFEGATSFNGDIAKWDVSRVTTTYRMFYGAVSFSGDISEWDVSSVTTMFATFFRAKSFNSDISKWNVASVTDMGAMFQNAESFNSDISKWDVSSVTGIRELFSGAESFDQDISKWDVSRVTNMIAMFNDAKTFNGRLSKWDVSSVSDMSGMFDGADAFNGGISKWDVSSVTRMSGMFKDAKAFNHDLSKWVVSGVTDMSGMFHGAIAFNGDISKWDVSSVTDMNDMFTNANMFSGDLSKWDVSRVTSILRIKGATGVDSKDGKVERLKWERLNEQVKIGNSSSKLEFTPGPMGGLHLAGEISMDSVGSMSCRTLIDKFTPPLGFSNDTVALLLEVTGDGQRYRVGLREKNVHFGSSDWRADFTTKKGMRTEVVLPLDKATWHEMYTPLLGKAYKLEKGKLPEWSQLRGIGVRPASLDLDGKISDHFPGPGPFYITVHSVELINSDPKV